MSRLKLIAWAIHFYTISGAVVATFGLAEVLTGDANLGFLLIIVSRLIDGTDGFLARRYKIWDVLPDFDGSNVDNLIDIFTYLWIPMVILWQAEIVPIAWIMPPIVGTLYVYGNKKMKSSDDFFVRFPALWGAILIYLYYLDATEPVAIGLLLFFTVLCFIPLRYLYPSKNAFLRTPTLILSMLWVITWLVILIADQQDLVWISMVYPLYYLGASFYASYKFRHIPL